MKRPTILFHFYHPFPLLLFSTFLPILSISKAPLPPLRCLQKPQARALQGYFPYGAHWKQRCSCGELKAVVPIRCKVQPSVHGGTPSCFSFHRQTLLTFPVASVPALDRYLTESHFKKSTKWKWKHVSILQINNINIICIKLLSQFLHFWHCAAPLNPLHFYKKNRSSPDDSLQYHHVVLLLF